MSVYEIRTEAILLDALHSQGERRVRQVLLDEKVRAELVARAKRVIDQYGPGLANGADHIMRVAAEL